MAGDPPELSERVISAVAAETDRRRLDLPPLYEAIDPDALDAVFRSLSDGEIRFSYAGCTVTVGATGELHVTADEPRQDGGERRTFEVADE